MAAVAAGSIGAAMFKHRGSGGGRNTADGTRYGSANSHDSADSPSGSSKKISLAPDVSETSEIPEPPMRRTQKTSSSGGRVGSKKHTSVDRFEIELQSVIRGNRASEISSTVEEAAASAGTPGPGVPSLAGELKALLAQGQQDMERLCEHELVTQLGLHVGSFSQCVQQMAEVRAAEAYRKALVHCRESLENEGNRRRQKLDQLSTELQNASMLLGTHVPKFKTEALSASGLEERREFLHQWEALLARRRKEEVDLREQITRLEIKLSPEERSSLAFKEDENEGPLSEERMQHLRRHVHVLCEARNFSGGGEQYPMLTSHDESKQFVVHHHAPVPRGFMTPQPPKLADGGHSELNSAPSSPSGSKPNRSRPNPHLEAHQAGGGSPSSRCPSSAAEPFLQTDSPPSSLSPKNNQSALKGSSAKTDQDRMHLGTPRSSLKQDGVSPRSSLKKEKDNNTGDGSSPRSSLRKEKDPGRSSLKKATNDESISPERGGEMAKELPPLDSCQEVAEPGPAFGSRRSEEIFSHKRSVEFSVQGSLSFSGRHSTEATFAHKGSMTSTTTNSGSTGRRKGVSEWLRRR